MGFYFFMPMISLTELYQIYLQYPNIVTDTRSPVKDCLFFCLKGSSFDGNEFAASALEKGARYALIDNPAYASITGTLLVANVLETLQALAKHHREQLTIPIIGITGTNGKTTTKELTTAVLSKKYRVTATKGNLNNHIGVPLTLLSITTDTEIAVIEMGANHPGEIAELCAIALPETGLITNIGKAHLEGFGSLEAIIETKTALYRNIKTRNGLVFIHDANALLKAKAEGLPYILYGSDPQSSTYGLMKSANPYVSVQWGSNATQLTTTQLAGAWNFENIMAAVCIGQYYKVSNEAIHEALCEYTPTNMRSQMRNTANNIVLLDAYNANPTSMRAAIQHFGMEDAENKTLILGDMRELGETAMAEHQGIIRLATAAGFKQLMLVGAMFSGLVKSKEILCFQDTEALCAHLKQHPMAGEHLLIKGSRGIGLEKAMDFL
jgi:UDP-N-acetylmuramoyl-tripeptide--D-alanyl-D-alanine ligase